MLSLASLWCFVNVANAQEKSEEEPIKNEIKLNLLNSVLGLPEVSFERLLQSNMSVGFTMGVGIGNGNDDFSQYRFLAIPYYRVYFGDTNGAGFFIEGNMGLGNVRQNDSFYDQLSNQIKENKETRFNFGLGAAIGKKYLTKNNYLGEIFGGVGRFFGNNTTADVYPRIGISLGKRF